MINIVKVISIVLPTSFLLYSMFFYLIRPSVVLSINNKDILVIRWGVLISISLAFACATAIGVFFYLVNNRNIPGNIYMDEKTEFIPGVNPM